MVHGAWRTAGACIEKKLNGFGFVQLKIATFAASSFVNCREKKRINIITQPLNYSTNNEKELLSDIGGGRFVHVFVYGGYL